MFITEEKTKNKRTFKVQLDRTAPHRVNKSYHTGEMEEVLRRDFDLSKYDLISGAPKICNFQSNNVGVYVFEKKEPSKKKTPILKKTSAKAKAAKTAGN